mmetsp:Transcript_20350/g.52961  ORF Transcript_20350/g.52961 Transcript_20350/m.52961 type:complete len:84 (+) Transcript_20350:368-619(+)
MPWPSQLQRLPSPHPAPHCSHFFRCGPSHEPPSGYTLCRYCCTPMEEAALEDRVQQNKSGALHLLDRHRFSLCQGLGCQYFHS